MQNVNDDKFIRKPATSDYFQGSSGKRHTYIIKAKLEVIQV
jgi:hypothetical protein